MEMGMAGESERRVGSQANSDPIGNELQPRSESTEATAFTRLPSDTRPGPSRYHSDDRENDRKSYGPFHGHEIYQDQLGFPRTTV